MNHLNKRQQLSPYKQILRPAPSSKHDGSDLKRAGWKSGLRRVISHNYYTTGHYSLDFKLKLKYYPSIFLNYEKRNADDKARVPHDSHTQARRLVDADNEAKVTVPLNNGEQRTS